MGCDAGLNVYFDTLTPFQSTHPVWGATRNFPAEAHDHTISIHAPRVGCDANIKAGGYVDKGISIHAPRVGCDNQYNVIT